MFHDCVVCLGDPCNEVHGMLLLLILRATWAMCIYLFVYLYRTLQLYVAGITAHVGVEVHGDARIEGLAVGSCAAVNFASRSKMNRLVHGVRRCD